MPTEHSERSAQPQPQQEPAQLVQAKVPLDSAADAFAARDASGRIPVVLVPARPLRIRNDLVAWGVGVLVVGTIAAGAGRPRHARLTAKLPAMTRQDLLAIVSSMRGTGRNDRHCHSAPRVRGGAGENGGFARQRAPTTSGRTWRM